jgi:hypothetical protein
MVEEDRKLTERDKFAEALSETQDILNGVLQDVDAALKAQSIDRLVTSDSVDLARALLRG